MLHRDFSLELKEVTPEGVVEGYASVFGGSPDLGGDIVAPGAFSESLAKHKRQGTSPLMLWGHDSFQPPIGNWVDMAEDGKGLWVKGEIDLEDPMGGRVHRALSRKSMKGMSIGYRTLDSDSDPKRPGVRILKQVELFEVSFVNMPMQPRAGVDLVKSVTGAGRLPTLPQFEDFLREAGFSKSEATAIAGKGLAHLLRSESGADQQAIEFLKGLRNKPEGN